MKKRVSILLLAGLLVLFLASCKDNGDSSLPTSGAASGEVPAVSELDQNIARYEQLVATDPSAENYTALAGFYEQAGRIRKQRDTLERSYRLHHDAASLEKLGAVAVNVAEESPALQEEARVLVQNLSIAEYQAEAVGMLMSPDWFSTMMPKLREGHRNYYWESPEDQSVLYMEVGYDGENENESYTRAWYVKEGQVTSLLHEGSAVQMLTTGLENGQYNGAFSSWLCVGNTGTVYHDTGTFANGVMVGEYTSGVNSAEAPTDLFSLFSTREALELTPYTGDFGDNGVATAEQPAGEGNTFVAYAYNSDKSNYLLFNMAEGADPASYVFDHSFLGLSAYPTYTPYAPVPDTAAQGEVTVDLAQVQVRVNDAAIEWFDGATWHEMGSVAEYVEQDPFQALEEAATSPAEDMGEVREESFETGQNSWLARRSSAQAESQSQSPASQSGSGASSRAASRAPSSQAAAAPPAEAPAPEQPQAPAPTPAPPAPDPAPEAPPPTGNDGEDIDWTNDIL